MGKKLTKISQILIFIRFASMQNNDGPSQINKKRSETARDTFETKPMVATPHSATFGMTTL